MFTELEEVVVADGCSDLPAAKEEDITNNMHETVGIQFSELG